MTGPTLEEHLRNLDMVLDRLHQAGIHLNRDKCFFLQPRIEYLGHVLDATGRHPTDEKLRAIKEAPTPQNVSELRAFLSIINYYGKFLPHLSDSLAPLYSLLKKHSKWSWGTPQDDAFRLAKDALQANTLLVHFDPDRPLLLSCDASQYGIGAVLAHVMENGQERPIAYASRTLNPAEKRYSQLDKEALAIVAGVKKFHDYLYGRHFTILSDHKPLSFLFREDKGVPLLASARVQRWALTLSAYNYSIQYKPGKQLGNADALSRLPRPITTPTHNCVPADLVNLVQHLASTCICASNIREWTRRDPVLRFLQSGWPEQSPGEDFKPYFSKKLELSLMDGCILWGNRVVVPTPGRKSILAELHETHPGVSRMKSLARCYIWWPQIDTEIERLVQSCTVCQQSRPSPAAAPLHPWVWPAAPWSRLHIDYAGPLHGHMFMVLADAHSKWLEVVMMNSITSSKTIEQLRILFATHGIPHKIVTNNGPSFISREFKEYMSSLGITHITSAPYHPSTNGLAERAVQTFKLGLLRTPGKSVQEKLSKFLFQYRITPHTTTGVSPAELLMGQRLHSRFDLLYPTMSEKVQTQQLKQKLNHDRSKPLRTFEVGDTVFAENFTNTPPKWLPGKVVKVTGPLSYQIELQSGILVRRHVDSVRRRIETDVDTGVSDAQDLSPPSSTTLDHADVDPVTQPDLPAAPNPAPVPAVPGEPALLGDPEPPAEPDLSAEPTPPAELDPQPQQVAPLPPPPSPPQPRAPRSQRRSRNKNPHYKT